MNNLVMSRQYVLNANYFLDTKNFVLTCYPELLFFHCMSTINIIKMMYSNIHLSLEVTLQRLLHNHFS